MKILNEEDKPALDDDTIKQIVVDTLVGATKKSDTKKRIEDALKTTPVSPKKIADALAPAKLTGSQSTKTAKSTTGTTGPKPAGSKAEVTTGDQNNSGNSTVSEDIYNKGKNMNKQIDEQAQPPVMNSAGKKVESKLEKIPGLDALLSAVRDKGNAGEILLQVAEGLGGDKLKASVALKTALNLALQKEKEPAAETAPAPLKEFVSYLFEGTER